MKKERRHQEDNQKPQLKKTDNNMLKVKNNRQTTVRTHSTENLRLSNTNPLYGAPVSEQVLPAPLVTHVKLLMTRKSGKKSHSMIQQRRIVRRN